MSDEQKKIDHATDETVCLWYCKDCNCSGAIILHGADVYAVIEAIDAGHKARRPECEAAIGRVRITRPESWYADTIVAETQKQKSEQRARTAAWMSEEPSNCERIIRG